MKTFDVEQGSDTWFELRRGRPTASSFNKILTPKTLKPSAQQDGYICELVGECLSLIPPEGVENYTNRAIRWGQQTEAEARSWYSMDRNCDVQRVGFITTDDDRFGCSPDGLVGEQGGLELKCPEPTAHIAYLLNPQSLLDAYKGQVHGCLIVCERKWWDLVSYCPLNDGPSALCVRVEPDAYTEKLREELDRFFERYVTILARIKGAA
jgi:hypothetical protein